MRLKEVNSGFTPETIAKQKQLKLDYMFSLIGITNFFIDNDGKVIIEQNVTWGTIPEFFLPTRPKRTRKISPPKYVLRAIKGNLIITDWVNSFEGFPETIEGDFDMKSPQWGLKSYVGMPTSIGGGIRIDRSNIESLAGIHKYMKKVGDAFQMDSVTECALGLLLVPTIEYIEVKDPTASEILRKHARLGKDIHMCQQELIDAGFGKLARL